MSVATNTTKTDQTGEMLWMIESLLDSKPKFLNLLCSRVRTGVEKSLNLTLVLENSWNLKIVPFVLELSLNFVKLSLKM